MKQKITDIQRQSDHPSQHKIYLDNNPFVVLPSELIEKFGLRIGLEIEAEVIEKLILADEMMHAKNYALDLLNDAIYSKSQMTRHLEREGYSEQTIETIITELIHTGHIRDKLFAENWIHRRLNSNPRGRTLLKQELIEKGVDRDIAEQALTKVKDEDQERLAFEIAEKQAKKYTHLPIQTAQRRLHGFLARRGFASEMIVRIIQQVL